MRKLLPLLLCSLSWASIARVGSPAGMAFGTGSESITSYTMTAGNLLMAGTYVNSTSKTVSVSNTGTAQTWYSCPVQPSYSTGYTTTQVYYAVIGTTQTVTVTATESASGTDPTGLGLMQYSGTDTSTNPRDVCFNIYLPSSTSTSAIASLTVATTATDGCVAITADAAQSSGTITNGSGWTSQKVDTGFPGMMEDQINTAAGSLTATATDLAASTTWAISGMCFRASGQTQGVTQVQVCGAAGTGTTAICTLGTTAAGDQLSVMSGEESGDTATIADSASTSYTADISAYKGTNTGGNNYIWRASNIAGRTASNTITVTQSPTSSGVQSITAKEWSGLATSGQPDTTETSSSSTAATSFTTGSYTLSGNDACDVQMENDYTGGGLTFSAGSGFTFNYTLSAWGSEFQVYTSSGSKTASMSANDSNQWAAVVDCYKPATTVTNNVAIPGIIR